MVLLTEEKKETILWDYMVVTHDFDKLSKYENIFHPQKEDYLTCIDDESSSGETVDDGGQGTDVGGLIKITSKYM